MFAPRYFAERYFAGRYFAQAQLGGGTTFADLAGAAMGAAAATGALVAVARPQVAPAPFSGGHGGRPARRRLRRARLHDLAGRAQGLATARGSLVAVRAVALAGVAAGGAVPRGAIGAAARAGGAAPAAGVVAGWGVATVADDAVEFVLMLLAA